MTLSIKFIDLFAGLGGMRIALENACNEIGINAQCVLTSEIKNHAIKTYQNNFVNAHILGDIAKVKSDAIPDFDLLLAGFPCQPFSSAGNRLGFLDTRGTLFFEIERILQEKQPFGFILENVEGLVKHDRGRTLSTIIGKLEQLDYRVTWKVLNSLDFGIPQDRKRIYIIGTKSRAISLDFDAPKITYLKDIIETGVPTIESKLIDTILSRFNIEELHGRSIKDKRGGEDNIHSWDLELKGSVSDKQKQLLSSLLKERRKKIWAEKKGIAWMDGMPLTFAEIASFYYQNIFNLQDDLQGMLKDLVDKGYLKYEHPKDLEQITDDKNRVILKRKYRYDLPKGYNIIVGKLSFEINKIIDPHGFAPTLVATDMSRLAVVDGKGIRKLTIREGLRLFGFPENYQIDFPIDKAYDLLGNTVVVTVIQAIAERLVIERVDGSYADRQNRASVPDRIYNSLPVCSK